MNNKGSALVTTLLKVVNVNVNKNNCNQIYVQFTGEGIFNGHSEKISGRFFVKNNTQSTGENGISTEFPKIPSSYTNKCSNLNNCNGMSNVILYGNNSIDKKETILINGLYIDGSLDISSTHSDLIIPSGNFYVNGPTTIGNQSTITVQTGNAYFKNITGATNAEITINGDAYFYGDITNFKTSSGNQLFVNITGTVYVSDNSDLPDNYLIYCNRSKARGICAADYKHLSEAPATNPDLTLPETVELDWSLDQPSIKIEYK